ncbi:MAG: hypothetical protein M1828_007323 [Chrysothrix sp. TS-e1954]|nr:MAG: hypothetical protein M1828_007323 [Chrysothrix sp. TS-e1954]
MRPSLLRPPRRPALTSSISANQPTTSNAHPRRPSFRPTYRSRSLHTTRPHRQTHYDTLSLPPSAPASAIKKSFYALSKTYHPDLNRGPHSDPEAAEQKFLAISEAYSILGDPKKREKYDRDVIGKGEVVGRASGFGGRDAGGGGGGPVGGRPASGLSKRRGQFTGPPPSFYRSGEWGGKGEKRREHQYRDPNAQQTAGGAAEGQQQRGPEGQEAPFLDPNDVPHFDRAGHYRSNMSVEEQLRQGRKRRIWARGTEGEPAKAGLGSIINGGDAADGMRSFLGISTVLGLAIALPFLFLGGWKR